MLSPQSLLVIISGGIESGSFVVGESEKWRLSRITDTSNRKGKVAMVSWEFTSLSQEGGASSALSNPVTIQVNQLAHPQIKRNECRDFYMGSIRRKKSSMSITGIQGTTLVVTLDPAKNKTEVSLQADEKRKLMTSVFDEEIGQAFAADLFLVSQFSRPIPGTPDASDSESD